MYRAEIGLEWTSLASHCVLHLGRRMDEDKVPSESVSVPLIAEHAGRVRHLVRIEGAGADGIPPRRSFSSNDVPFSRVSRSTYVGVIETHACPVYKAVQSASCFLLRERASKKGAFLYVAGESAAAIKSLVRELRKNGVEARVKSVSRMSGSRSLTPRQEQALSTAYREGFFEYPHETSLKLLSDLLGCSPATYAVLLRKAEQKLVSRHLAGMFST